MIALLDSSAFIMWQQLSGAAGFDIFKKIETHDGVDFKIMNDVWVELSQKESEKTMDRFLSHIVNSVASYSRNHRFESSVALGTDGQPYVVRHNKLSGVDWAQIQTCQKHKDYILVTNDRKLLKSALKLLPDRVDNPLDFLLKIAATKPDDPDLQMLKKIASGKQRKPVFGK